MPPRGHALLLVLALLFKGVASADEPALLVSAAASLSEPLRELQEVYRNTPGAVRVTYNFGGSGTLARQIENGAPVDVFLSAGVQQMDDLEKEQLLVPGTRRDLLRNTLVLVTPKQAMAIKSFDDLISKEVQHVAIGDPRSAPAGLYATKCFAALKLSPAIDSKVVRLLDVRQVLTAVETGNADAGVVYRTDALLSGKVRIAVTAPAESHPPITYPLAAIRRPGDGNQARRFVEFLASEPALAVFEKYGFAVVR